ncbi:hypothetical protein N9987_00195 [bacterium]|nr:hypothetical protein [bacterium]
MADNNTIEIKFSATGDDKVIKAINDLDKSTKELIKTQANLRGEGQKQKKNTEALRENNRKLYSELKKNGIKSFKGLSLETGVLTRALQGNKVAIRKVRTEMQRLSKTQKNVKKGLLDTEHGTRILGGSFAVLRSKMLLASFGAGLFGASIGRLTRLYGEQEQAEKKLETALGKRSNALLAFASAQQKVTTFGDEETIVAMSLVGAYTDNEKAIAMVTEASMDLASAKGMDLNSAIDMVSKSIFSSTNAMSRYGIEVTGTQGTVERLESATKNISELYGGQAKAQAETFNGAMIQMNNALGDTGEVIGSIFAPAVLLGARGLQSFAESINTKNVKEFGLAVGVLSAGLVYYKRQAVLASIATLRFGKAMKLSGVGLAVAGLMVLIDKMGIFGEESENLLEKLKELNGEMSNLGKGGVDNKKLESQERELELLSAKIPLLKDGITFSEQQKLLNLEEQHINKDAEENQISDFERRKKLINIKIQETKLEEDIKNAKLQGASSLASALSNLNTMAKGNAKVSKRLAQASAIIDTYAGANKAFAQGGVLGFLTGSAIIAQGMANVAQIEAQKFEKGGEVGGKRHSQGGTMIEAERGEFVMSRSAVQSIGVETLNQMNNGGGSGITLNISAPLVDQTIVDTIIPAIQKAQRMNLA